MKRATLRELDQSAFSDAAVASSLPTSWKEAIAAYVEWRTAQVKQSLMDLKATSEFQAKDIAYQCGALAEIQKKLAKDVTRKPTVRIVEPDKRLRAQNEIDLAALLTPSGWEKVYGPVIEAMHHEAETEILQQKNVRANQALGGEIEVLMTFMQGVEERARRASAEQHRGIETRRTRDSAVRLVM